MRKFAYKLPEKSRINIYRSEDRTSTLEQEEKVVKRDKQMKMKKGSRIKIKNIKKPALKKLEESEAIFKHLNKMDASNPFETMEKHTLPFKTRSKIEGLLKICSSQLTESGYDKRALYIRATLFMRLKDYQGCISDCSKLINYEPNNTSTYYLRGLAYQKIGQINESITDFTKVLENDSHHFNAALARASCYNYIGEFDLAIQDYETGLQRDSYQGGIHRRKEGLAYKSIDFSSQRNTAGVKSNSQNQKNGGGSYKNRGEIIPEDTESELIRPEEPVEGWNIDENAQKKEEEERRSSSSNKPFTGRSSLTSSQSNLKRTMNSKNLEEVDRLHKRGYQARKEGDLEIAIELYTLALNLNPYHYKSYFNRGFVYDKMEKFELAIQDYMSAIEIDPKNPFAYYNKGIALNKIEDFESAYQSFDSAISLDSTKADFYHNRGFSLRKLCEYEKAINDFTNALDLDSSHFKAQFNRAFCLEKIGQYRDAIRDFESCLSMDPENQSALFALANLHYQQGPQNLDLAIAGFQRYFSFPSLSFTNVYQNTYKPT